MKIFRYWRENKEQQLKHYEIIEDLLKEILKGKCSHPIIYSHPLKSKTFICKYCDKELKKQNGKPKR